MCQNFCRDQHNSRRCSLSNSFRKNSKGSSVPKIRLTVFLMSGLLSLAALAGCSSGQSAATRDPNSRYTIVTTCGMVTDIVRQVAGQRANVMGLMGEGIDPHLYSATRDDVAQLSTADVVIYSGLTLEGRMVDIFEQLRKSRTVVAVTDGIDRKELRQPEGHAGHYDPHVWMDVSLWSRGTQKVAEALAEYDPPHAAEYRKNAETYQAELKRLDEYVMQVIASIPEKQRILVTAHDAFGYFSRHYEIPVRSPQGISTESEASVKDINELVDFLVKQKIPTIFVETSTNANSLRAVIEGAGQRGVKVALSSQPLFSDAMGAPGTYEGTYIGMLDHNATVIARSLGGDAPERGLQGKLSVPPAAK